MSKLVRWLSIINFAALESSCFVHLQSATVLHIVNLDPCFPSFQMLRRDYEAHCCEARHNVYRGIHRRLLFDRSWTYPGRTALIREQKPAEGDVRRWAVMGEVERRPMKTRSGRMPAEDKITPPIATSDVYDIPPPPGIVIIGTAGDFVDPAGKHQ